MLPLQVVINNLPGPSDILTPILTFVGIIIVAGIGAWSLTASDKRKMKEDTRRRWDADLVSTVVKMLVITDDVASTVKQAEEKLKSIRANDISIELRAHLVKIYLLTNDSIGDLGQQVVFEYMRYRSAMRIFIEEADANGTAVDVQNFHPKLSLLATSSDEYQAAYKAFTEKVRELVVLEAVRLEGQARTVDFADLFKKYGQQDNLNKPTANDKKEEPQATAVRTLIP